MKNEQKHSEIVKNNWFYGLKTQIKQISTYADQDFTIVWGVERRVFTYFFNFGQIEPSRKNTANHL